MVRGIRFERSLSIFMFFFRSYLLLAQGACLGTPFYRVSNMSSILKDIFLETGDFMENRHWKSLIGERPSIIVK
jgi:hypothetical protein